MQIDSNIIKFILKAQVIVLNSDCFVT